MENLSEATRADLRRYQDIVEKLRAIAINRQQLQLQLSELDSALNELSKTPENYKVYKIIGTIMVQKKKEELENELKELRETIEIRLKTLTKQEELLKSQLEELEKKLTRKLGRQQSTAG